MFTCDSRARPPRARRRHDHSHTPSKVKLPAEWPPAAGDHDITAERRRRAAATQGPSHAVKVAGGDEVLEVLQGVGGADAIEQILCVEAHVRSAATTRGPSRRSVAAAVSDGGGREAVAKGELRRPAGGVEP